MFKYIINDPQKKITAKLHILFAKANSYLSKEIKKKYYYDVTVIDDIKIKHINSKYCNIHKTTDVISFAFHDAKSIKTSLIGEIFINYQQAQRQATLSYENEMVFLFTHGLLHLLGFNHDNPKNEKEMFDLQNKIMQELNLVG
jgi:probable rRNA maturation factor